MFPGQFLLIWSLAPWILFVPVLMVKSSGQTTLSLVSLVLETTGPRVTTLRELNWLTLYLMSSGKKLKGVTVFRYVLHHVDSSLLLFHLILCFIAGIPTDTLLGRWYWLWHGNTLDLQNSRRIPRSYHEHFLRCSFTQGF